MIARATFTARSIRKPANDNSPEACLERINAEYLAMFHAWREASAEQDQIRVTLESRFDRITATLDDVTFCQCLPFVEAFNALRKRLVQIRQFLAVPFR